VKRHELIRILAKAGCVFLKHGKNHDIYINIKNGRKAPIPRHIEIKNTLCELIKKQLGIN
jgi:hypothetical protein